MRKVEVLLEHLHIINMATPLVETMAAVAVLGKSRVWPFLEKQFEIPQALQPGYRFPIHLCFKEAFQI